MENMTPLTDVSVNKSQTNINAKHLYKNIISSEINKNGNGQFPPFAKKISNFDPNGDILDISQQAFLLAGLQKNAIEPMNIKPDFKLQSKNIQNINFDKQEIETVKIKTEKEINIIRKNKPIQEQTYNKFGKMNNAIVLSDKSTAEKNEIIN